MLSCLPTKKKSDPFDIYIEIVKNKKLDSLKTLIPTPTSEEKKLLLQIYDHLPHNAQNIIYYTCIDNGAGTGIRKN
tara:strand:+ start:936 stop:1163 length:228 start_codon:yes stop_codon:yes gene_type:complete